MTFYPNVSLFPHLHTPSIPPSPFTPSIINLMVSVDVKHHVYFLCKCMAPQGLQQYLMYTCMSSVVTGVAVIVVVVLFQCYFIS